MYIQHVQQARSNPQNKDYIFQAHTQDFYWGVLFKVGWDSLSKRAKAAFGRKYYITISGGGGRIWGPPPGNFENGKQNDCQSDAMRHLIYRPLSTGAMTQLGYLPIIELKVYPIILY